jgi:hypothetical protein
MRPPKIIKPYVMTFARQVVGCDDVTPFYVECFPLNGGPHNECFALVESYITIHGGEMIVGWAIWERPKVFIEAEFHAIWRSPDGRFVDIVPRQLPIQRILFIHDARRRYSGVQIDNKRKPLNNDKDVKRFLELHALRFRLLNEGKLKHYHGWLDPTPQMLAVDKEAAAIELKIIQRYGMWLPENT